MLSVPLSSTPTYPSQEQKLGSQFPVTLIVTLPTPSAAVSWAPDIRTVASLFSPPTHVVNLVSDIPQSRHIGAGTPSHRHPGLLGRGPSPLSRPSVRTILAAAPDLSRQAVILRRLTLLLGHCVSASSLLGPAVLISPPHNLPIALSTFLLSSSLFLFITFGESEARPTSEPAGYPFSFFDTAGSDFSVYFFRTTIRAGLPTIIIRYINLWDRKRIQWQLRLPFRQSLATLGTTSACRSARLSLELVQPLSQVDN